MNARLFLAAILIGLCPSLGAPAAQAGGTGDRHDVYLLGVALDQAGAAGGGARVGPAGAWKNTLAGAVVNGLLYSTDSDGALYRTSLDTGSWEQVGKPEFGNTRLMVGAGDRLFTIETNGSLYRVDPATGGWARVGADGAWAGATAGAVLHGQLFSAEKDGALYATDLTGGAHKQVGKPEAKAICWLAALGNELYAINDAGDLYAIDPADGASRRVGRAGDWKQTNAVGVLNGQLYTTEATGGFRRTDPRTGRRLPARGVSQSGRKYVVHYLGKGRDDTVDADRVRYPFVGGMK